MIAFQKLPQAKEMSNINGCLWINCKKIAMDVSKQQALDTDLRLIQQFSFTGNLERGNDKTHDDDKKQMIFILEAVKRIILHFLQGTLKVL